MGLSLQLKGNMVVRGTKRKYPSGFIFLYLAVSPEPIT